MEASSAKVTVTPPWNHPGFLSEEALRAAQEYYFQTHATNSKLIAQGRNAQGFMKSGLRRKLTKEMGEDFKMYTGVSIGAESSESAVGIRSELNALLENVYRKIAPTQPITSPTQEDLTILKHPLGALEVCYCLTFFYTHLQKKYVTLAGNRRQVLKSVLDEEMFKWIWRMSIGFLVSEDENKLDFDNRLPTGGLSYVPPDAQGASSAEKVLEVGSFMLSNHLRDSHLRFSLCYYFATYIRQIQFQLLAKHNTNADKLYERIRNPDPKSGVGNILIAIDMLLNMHGNSNDSFESVLQDHEKQMQTMIPEEEIAFILQFQEFTESKFDTSLAKFVPRGRQSAEADNPAGTLMPLMLILRTMPRDGRERILGRIPGPFLGLLSNRIQHGSMDEPDRILLDHVHDVTDRRRKSGETYTIVSQVKGRATTTSAKAAEKAPAGAGGKAGAAGSKPAPAAAASGTAGASGTARTSGGAATAAQAQPAARPAADRVTHERLLIAWRAEGASLEVTSISPVELFALAGNDAHILRAWVMVALQSNQVFGIPHNEITKERLNSLVSELSAQAGKDSKPRLSADKIQQLLKLGAKAPRKVLLALAKALPAERSSNAGSLGPTLGALGERLGEQFGDFLRNAMQPEFAAVLGQLSPEEKRAVGVLQRVARLP